VNTAPVSVSLRLQKATSELRDVEARLSSADLDPRILSDFRDAVNRVRTTAWATQQYAETKDTESDPTTVLSLLASERIRTAYQLCRAIREDLDKSELHFQPGQLIHLHAAARDLVQKLTTMLGEPK
jgi:sulfite reductase alpha subunit-like flavoprotein